jgi:DNA-3-methyladenine glycosylase II
MITPEIRLHLAQDAQLKPVLESVELIQWGSGTDVYCDLLESIVSQQLSVKAAATIHGRFVQLFDDGFPHPEKLLAMDLGTLRSVGLSQQKANYMLNVANFFVEQQLHGVGWSAMTDLEIIQRLTQIKGVGRWTVEMILMFTLHRPDILPVDDLGIQNAMKRLYRLETTGKALRQQMTELAEPWRPYRTYACRYLWKWKDGL